MFRILIVACLVLALTWTTACLLIPSWPAFALVWISVIIFTIAVLILFSGIVKLSSLVKEVNRKNPTSLYPLSGYVVFCFLAIFFSLLLSSYSSLLILHLLGILGACIIGLVMNSACQKSASYASDHKADKNVAVNRAEILSEICRALKKRREPELSSFILKIHLFSEKLRYAAGCVDSTCDAEIDELILKLEVLSEDEIFKADLLVKLPSLLQKIENKLDKRERLAIL